MKLELHPLCSIFPRIVGGDFESLKADIKDNGLNHPIVLFEGMILDGGNRYRVCAELGIEPKTIEYTGANPVAFVLSENLHRRHLTQIQQAAIVACAQDWSLAHSGGNVAGNNQHRKKEDGVQVNSNLTTTAERAAMAGVGHMTQRRADTIAKASPELARKVAHGEVTVADAMRSIGRSEMLGGKESAKVADAPGYVAPEPKKADPLAKVRDEVRAARKKGFPTALNHFAKQALSFIKVQSQEEVKFSDEEIDVLREIAQSLNDVGIFQSIA
jgi:ParB-like chromosome segregation protein Spo0J